MPRKSKKSASRLEKPLESKEESASAKPLSKEYVKQFYWIIGAIIVLFLVFFVTYTFFQGRNQFTYNGLAFTKEKIGSIPIYHYYYYFPTENGAQKQFNLYLREDPRNNPVMVNDKISLPANKQIYISLTLKDFETCTKATGSFASLVSFLLGNEFELKTGTGLESEAYSKNISYINCYTDPDKTVLMFSAGNESKISKENKCYKLEVANCDLLSVVEKFMVQSVIDARNQAIEENSLVTIVPSEGKTKIISKVSNSSQELIKK